MDHLYHHIAAHVLSRPWAIMPETLAVMADLLALRMSGDRLSAEEIQARIEAAKPAPVRRVRSGNVAIVPIQGVITHRADMFSQISGMTSLDTVRADLTEALNDKKVDTVALYVDSPGGSTDGVAETAAMIRDARASKRIVAFADTKAASAAYWIASQAHEIGVTPSGIVGSIGVYTMHRDLSKALEARGETVTLIKAGKYKTEGHPFGPLDEEAQAAIQQTVDDMYGMFVADVAAGRGVSPDAVRTGYGEGRALTASRALQAGMVDSVEPFASFLARYRGTAPAPQPPAAPARSKFTSKARLSAGLVLSTLPR